MTKIAAALALALLLPSLAPAVQPGFPHGVASGEVTPTSAVLWTRTDVRSRLKLEVATDPDFDSIVFKRTGFAVPANDRTIEIRATGLRPATAYWYRWRHGKTTSETGRFRTAPMPSAPANVRLAWTADSDSLHSIFGNTFEVLDAVRADQPDAFVYLGDTIYSDSSLRLPVLGLGPATTLAEYREAYRMNRDFASLRNLLASTSTYAIWDDHEVRNDFDGQTVDPALYANGRRAFLDWMPLRDAPILQDPTCAGPPLFRRFRWGSEADVVILDERSCRSADVAASCLVAPGVADLAPTLPPAVRAAFGGLLPVDPPPGCVAAIFDPARTMLGPVQKAALKAFLEGSTAPFKIIVNEVPIQQFFALPYDRWEGYGAERNEILAFIRDHVAGHVLFLTTDMHANLIAGVRLDVFTAPGEIAREYVTGPIATFTFQEEVEAFAGQIGVDPALLVGAFQSVLNLAGVECRNLDVVSYGLLEVDAAAGTASITLKDAAGAPVLDQLGGFPCTDVVGD